MLWCAKWDCLPESPCLAISGAPQLGQVQSHASPASTSSAVTRIPSLKPNGFFYVGLISDTAAFRSLGSRHSFRLREHRLLVVFENGNFHQFVDAFPRTNDSIDGFPKFFMHSVSLNRQRGKRTIEGLANRSEQFVFWCRVSPV